MKLAFSTIGCPGYDWADVYTMASDLGFDGIEIRGLGRTPYAPAARPFTPRYIDETISMLAVLGLEISCFSTNNELADPAKHDENVAEVIQYIHLARKMGTQYVRVLSWDVPQPTGATDDEYLVSIVRELTSVAEQEGVTLLIETSSDYADTKHLAKVIDAVDSPAFGALWDMHHPYRFFGETPEQTVANLGRRIKYVQVKDSVMTEDGHIGYRLMGDGDMPLYQMFSALDAINFEGYVTLEWVARWASDVALGEPGTVFPQFLDYMREYMADRYGVSALERTTAEIFDDLKQTDIPKDLYDEMKQLFEVSDFVKFAKLTVPDEDNAKVVPAAVRFVTSTYQTEIDEEADHVL